MKTEEYNKLAQFGKAHGMLIPLNEPAHNLMDLKQEGDVFHLKDVSARDLSFHRCYFSLLNYIYSYMPKVFKEAIPEAIFSDFLKYLNKNYDVVFKFNDGKEFIRLHSISFGRMSQDRFEEYIRNQLPTIYEELIRPVYSDDEKYNAVIENIEEEFKKFLSKLN